MVKIGSIELPEFPLLLAPMEDVSDPPFRALCKEQGADVVYTEFISSEGLIRDAVKSTMKLDIYEKERPVGIQIFGANLDSMLQAIDIVEKSNPDIIDINFGCPVKKVVSKGAGAGILKDVCLMEKLTAEMVKRTNLPVTVKTRLGWDHDSIHIVKWLSGCKMWVVRLFLFTGAPVRKCIKALPIGGQLQRLKTILECIFLFLEMGMSTRPSVPLKCVISMDWMAQ